jgi:hypothetical protein
VRLLSVARLLLLPALLLSWTSRSDHAATAPSLILWAWERPEDLRRAPAGSGVAYLDRTLTITDTVRVDLRHQPLLVRNDQRLTAVVRIEAPYWRAKLAQQGLLTTLVKQVMAAAQRDGVTALQIDFDAIGSQREFYARLIREVRARLPEEKALSITALVSWCVEDPSWLRGLPINEAVPMFFRMEGVSRYGRTAWSNVELDRVCRGSVGVSMDEPWPKIKRGDRVYVFHPRAWNAVAFGNLEGKLGR